MIEVFKAPEKYPTDSKFTIFLAGTIEMGKSIDWQKDITELLKDEDIRILNPRRDEFKVWEKQSINNPYFKEQVNWELDGLERADLIIMNLIEDSLSPISMMEIAYFIKEKPMIICVPDGFWRKGNIEILADRNKKNCLIVNEYDEFTKQIKKSLDFYREKSKNDLSVFKAVSSIW